MRFKILLAPHERAPGEKEELTFQDLIKYQEAGYIIEIKLKKPEVVRNLILVATEEEENNE